MTALQKVDESVRHLEKQWVAVMASLKADTMDAKKGGTTAESTGSMTVVGSDDEKVDTRVVVLVAVLADMMAAESANYSVAWMAGLMEYMWADG
jgi:hypothetical protein